MYLDTILFPIITLGPGNRLVIWTKGCSKKCKGCANPELWSNKNAKNVSGDELCAIINEIKKENRVDGITFTGGDPLEQYDEIIAFLEKIKPSVNDILMYTGYTYEELNQLHSKEEIQHLRKLVSVLIDGKYEEEKNYSYLALRGSENQNIWYFDDNVIEKYEEYLKLGRTIQNVQMGMKIISAGIHNREGDNDAKN